MKYRTNKNKAEAQAELLAGAKLKVISKKYGYHLTTVQRWALNLGVQRKPGTQHFDWMQHQELLNSALTGKEVARRIGCSMASVTTQRKIIRDHKSVNPYQTDYLGWLKRMIAKYGKNIVAVRRGEGVEERLAGLGRNAIVLR